MAENSDPQIPKTRLDLAKILKTNEFNVQANLRIRLYQLCIITCYLLLVDAQHRDSLLQIHTNVSSILRIINSSQKVKTDLLGTICKDTYLMILDKFPWARITLTLHKVLAHSEEFNSGNQIQVLIKKYIRRGI